MIATPGHTDHHLAYAFTAALRGSRDSMAAELFGDMPAAQLEAFQGGLEVVIERLRAMG